MGRASLNIKREDLLKVCNELEAKETFSNHSRLFEAVCATDWAKNMTNSVGYKKPLAPINIYQYAKTFNLLELLKTAKGKKGNPNLGKVDKNPGGRTKRMESKPGYYVALNELKSNFKERPRLLKNVLKGSLSAAIKAKCLDCCCGSISEVSKCTVYGCPLYLISPIAGKANIENSDLDKGDDDEVHANI